MNRIAMKPNREMQTSTALARDIQIGLADAILYRRMGRVGLHRACVRCAWYDRAELRRRGVRVWSRWS